MTRIRPSGSSEIVPSSRVGTRSARRPIGRRLLISDVMRPLECTSLSVCQPPAVVVFPATPIASTSEVIAKVKVFVRCGAGAGSVAPRPDGVGAMGAAQAAARIARTNTPTIRGERWIGAMLATPSDLAFAPIVALALLPTHWASEPISRGDERTYA